MNIPIYRAKKSGSGEYIIGHSTEKVKEYPGKHYIHFNNGYTETYERIDPKTLAIHFKDMVDSEGNKIFASLSEDGKGGDITQDSYVETGYSFVNRISDGMWMQTININTISQRSYDRNNFYPPDIEVIGIQE